MLESDLPKTRLELALEAFDNWDAANKLYCEEKLPAQAKAMEAAWFDFYTKMKALSTWAKEVVEA